MGPRCSRKYPSSPSPCAATGQRAQCCSLGMVRTGPKGSASLTPCPHVSPVQNLLRAGSSVLAPENREHWAMLPHSEHGSASLMEQLRDYSGTLASNMKLTYLNPVGVVTPNISE